MGVRLAVVNLDQLFHSYLTKEPKIINDFLEFSEEDKNEFNRLIYTQYKGDVLSNLPTCDCGELVGGFNLGVTCTHCGTQVSSHVDKPLEPIIWIRAPIGVKALVNPIIWMMLKERFTRSGFEVIRWICDTSYKPSVKVPPIINALVENNVPRGLNSFFDNFDAIMDFLFNIRNLKEGQRPEPLYRLLQENRDCVFAQHIPVPNRAMFVVEESNVDNYIDQIITGAINAIQIMKGIDTSMANHSVRTKENRSVKTISELATYYEGLMKTTLAKKTGTFRKHIYGSRSNFSFRAVISSLTREHDYDEIHISWGIGLSVFKIHLTNKLMKRGFTPVEAKAYLNSHAKRYDPLLDQLFQELINESPRAKLSCVSQRNPSLERGSAQLVYITKVKTDPHDPTVGISILTVKGYNARMLAT